MWLKKCRTAGDRTQAQPPSFIELPQNRTELERPTVRPSSAHQYSDFDDRAGLGKRRAKRFTKKAELHSVSFQFPQMAAIATFCKSTAMPTNLTGKHHEKKMLAGHSPTPGMPQRPERATTARVSFLLNSGLHIFLLLWLFAD